MMFRMHLLIIIAVSLSVIVESGNCQETGVDLTVFLESGGYDPDDTRLLFSPTARPLRGGQAYINMYGTWMVLLPLANVGITDFFSLAGGVSLIPWPLPQAVYFAPKITPIHTKYVSIAGGGLFLSTTDDVNLDTGIGYGIVTVGSEKLAATFGLGWGYAQDEVDHEPVILVGGEIRLNRHVKLISENWLAQEESWLDFGKGTAYMFLGARFTGKKSSADAGVIHLVNAAHPGVRSWIPWIGITVNFDLWRR
jgi:hypothetical protein